ncbi:MAG: MBOAT family O-acyltransferase [Algibacter sp.]|uniref:MBOAT family O-acyltransferase n=1 Tax=Algibacter sp. TaxID=1872428 RepID=UPI0026175029|nr:MBOAT family O-acyltransferase [Algibacter sp.]MDG1729351.1 MBOAT family O-acyltransferase [Algibacter sp.]MDG2177322.1 MBOAT family O-acyltransferase [Algibacter sp.]
MFFNSIAFLLFLPTVFFLYWFLLKRSQKYQNILLLVASYFFYGWWDYRFLLLIALSTLIDYSIGLKLEKETVYKKRKYFLAVSLIFNLGMLGFFKYYNFFIESWLDSWAILGFKMHASTMQIILPVGISFYTFQTLSYTIDVYRKKLKPTRNFINFATFVAFFPQLVAGPIERAANLLPQFSVKRTFNLERAKSGIHLIIWGLFKKVVIADGCATYVNAIFDNYQDLNTLTLIIGAVYFAFQIYGDFSGYSDIAIGTARLFGFELMQNFNYPYFSRDVAEFWRRWHISLSTWFRDYLYIPLGGSRTSTFKKVRNVFIIFLVSGFWHGANWTFIIWGALHALFFIPLLITNKNRKYTNQVAEHKAIPSFRELINMLITFVLVTLAWVFFRADSITVAFNYIKRLFTNFSFNIEYLSIENYSIEMLFLIGVFIFIEWLNKHTEHPFLGKFKWFKIIGVILMLLIFGVYSNHQEFIYFQF